MIFNFIVTIRCIDHFLFATFYNINIFALLIDKLKLFYTGCVIFDIIYWKMVVHENFNFNKIDTYL